MPPHQSFRSLLLLFCILLLSLDLTFLSSSFRCLLYLRKVKFSLCFVSFIMFAIALVGSREGKVIDVDGVAHFALPGYAA